MSKRRTNEALDNTAEQPTDDIGAFPPESTEPGEQQAKPTYNPVRSWKQRYVDPVRYQVLTDSRINKIIIKFKLSDGQKTPSDDVLAVMRAAKVHGDASPTGLRFEDTRLHGKVWTLPNDVEGRATLAAIEMKLDELGAQPVPEQQTAK